jgi:hypothetical protein
MSTRATRIGFAQAEWRSRVKHWIAGTMLVVAATVALAQEKLPPPFPRKNATQLFENDRIRIWDIAWPKGEPTALHRHIYDQVGTYYAAGGRKITQPGSEGRTGVTQVGSLSTTKKGTTHIEEGTTDPPLRAVFIELKQDTPSGLPTSDGSSPPFPRDGAKQAVDDDRVTVWDTMWTAGPTGLRYHASRETVIVWLGEGTLRVTGAGEAATTLTVKPGTMRHLDRGSPETLEVESGSPRTMFFLIK